MFSSFTFGWRRHAAWMSATISGRGSFTSSVILRPSSGMRANTSSMRGTRQSARPANCGPLIAPTSTWSSVPFQKAFVASPAMPNVRFRFMSCTQYTSPSFVM